MADRSQTHRCPVCNRWKWCAPPRDNDRPQGCTRMPDDSAFRDLRREYVEDELERDPGADPATLR